MIIEERRTKLLNWCVAIFIRLNRFLDVGYHLRILKLEDACWNKTPRICLSIINDANAHLVFYLLVFLLSMSVCLCTLSSQKLSMIAFINHILLERKFLPGIQRKTQLAFDKNLNFGWKAVKMVKKIDFMLIWTIFRS